MHSPIKAVYITPVAQYNRLMMTYKLYLDDIRWPKGQGWIIVRSYSEAVAHVQKYGFPYLVSFDHDLGDDSKSGHDFAKWLVAQDLVYGSMPDDFQFNVHSANPVGLANIEGLLRSYMAFRLVHGS